MAITEVEANLARDSTVLESTDSDSYEGNLTAPTESGEYSIEILAYDDAGNVTVANAENTEGLTVSVTKWKTPRTDWKATDRFNIEDYNRIKGNLEHLHDKAKELYCDFTITNMGEDIGSYEAYWDYEKFNSFETNLETINKNILTMNYGTKKTFYPNGAFIDYTELNRIEGAILSIQKMLSGQENGKKKLSFRLGMFKEVKA